MTEKNDALSSPSIRYSTPASPALAQSLPPYDGASTRDVPSSPPLVTTKDRGMSWVAGGPKVTPTKQNLATPTSKGKTGASSDTLDGSSKGGKVTTRQPPRGPFKRKETNKLPSSPKLGTSVSNKRSDSSMSSPSRSGGGGGAGRGVRAPTAVTTEWNNDRFATGKAEAFMLSQNARWNSSSKWN